MFKPDNAISDFTEDNWINPGLAGVLSNRGIAYCNKGDFDKAIADYTESIRIDPKFAAAYRNRAATYGKDFRET